MKNFTRLHNSGLSRCRFLGLVILTLVAACATSTSEVNERFDARTGVTVTFVNAPLVLYRENPSQAAFARNFVHVGPVQVNRSGNYRHFLWLGIWSTMQPTDPATYRDGFSSILLFADGEPLSLQLAGWTPEAIGVSEPPYLKPVASTADAYYEVTADQIRLIAQADDIRLQATGPFHREYGLWNTQTLARQELAEFVRSAAR